MNIIKLFLVFIQIMLFATVSTAQPTCTGWSVAPCLPSATQHVGLGHNWHRSHGSLTLSGNNSPGSTDSSLSMSSLDMYHMNSGAFTCFKFEKGKTYRVCFWVRNVSGYPGGWVYFNPHGKVFVYAADGIYDDDQNGWIPSYPSQLIDDSYYGPGFGDAGSDGITPWKFISDTFTAKNNFTNLWIYPYNPAGLSPPGPIQWGDYYTVEVDDIRVMAEPAPFVFTTSDNTGGSISGCNDSAQITLSGIPATGSGSGAIATWTPAPISSNANGTIVTVKPCSTTTYKMEITDQSASCPTCIREVIYHTIEVGQWSDPARIIYPTYVIPCTDTFTLRYNNPGTCGAMNSSSNYKWIEPDGITSHTGNPFLISAATAYQTGEWTLQILNTNKGCAEEHKFHLTVGSCCVAKPDFMSSGCNPVSFSYTGGGITNLISTLWTFGDGTTSTALNPVHTYSVAGNYTVCLTSLFEDGRGESCCDRKCKTVTACGGVGCAASSNFNFSPAGSPNTYNFTDASSGSGGICNYYWEFNDGSANLSTSVPFVARHLLGSGPWNVCLTVTNCVYNAQGAFVTSCINKRCKLVPAWGGRMAMKGTEDNLPADLLQAFAGYDNPSDATVSSTNILTAYPNPNRGNFTLYLSNRIGSYNVIVRDKLSRVIYNSEHMFNNAPVNITLNDEANGVYSVEVRNSKEQFVEQISIIK